jgi:hypothetical protein
MCWLNELKLGAKPSELLKKEFAGNASYTGNDLYMRFLDKVFFSSDEEYAEFDLQSLFYPITRWKKPDGRRKFGISDEEMDREIVAIMTDWEIL